MNCYQTFQEKEKFILNKAIEKAEKKVGTRKIKNSNVKEIIRIVETFIEKNNLVCYGGIAINNILPENAQFYDFNTEIPDYDFFSPNAYRDVKKLADILYKEGFENVEAKSGVHKATYRLFVDFFQVADITNIDKKVFNKIQKSAIIRRGIKYSPPNLLRMMSYNELSRPNGQVSRWEKVMKRLVTLNKYFPIKSSRCDQVQFQRDFESDDETKRDIYFNVRNTLIDEGVVFFGGWATSLYGNYMPIKKKEHLDVELPDFDVISNQPEVTANVVKRNIINYGYKSVRIKKHNVIEDVLPQHYEILVDNNSICFIYDNKNCYSYNIIKKNKRNVKVATIDTILKFYLAFVYCDRKYYDVDRLLCMSIYLLQLQNKNKLTQKGLLKRFTTTCYGNEKTIEDIREERHNLYQKTKSKPNSKEYKENFMKYSPKDALKHKIAHTKKKKKRKNRKDTRKFLRWFGI